MLKQIIKKNHRRLEKKVKENDQSFTAKIYIKLLSWLRPIYFSNEFLLVNGLKKKNLKGLQSVLFFTVNKSASTFVKNTIINLVDGKLTTIRLAGYLPLKKHAGFFNDEKKMSRVLLEKGIFYGAFKDYYDFPGMNNFKVLLVLRDPRDVLTSQYFTVLYNHPIGRKEIIDRRKHYTNFTIDEFVLDQANTLLKKYEDYASHLLHKPNVLLLKYEDMITDFENWLKKLAAFLEIGDRKEYMDNLIKQTSFTVQKEDPNSFIRNIKAGDHKNKLKPETIHTLNAIFQKTMKDFNYAV